MFPKANIRVYGCGAFGIKTAKRIENNGLADICFVDTSSANIGDTMPDTYRIDGLRGAGQNRRYVYSKVLPHIEPILNTFEPATFNIVIFSTAGGSGSVLGPLLVHAMQKNNHTVVAIALSDDSTAKYLSNSIETIQSLEGLTNNSGKPIVMVSARNESGIPLSHIDEDVDYAIQCLFQLGSQNNEDLDEEDIHNWVNFNNVTNIPAQLAMLRIHHERQAAIAVAEPIATLSLYNDREDYAPVGTPHYSKTGYPRDLMHGVDQLHFVINTVGVSDLFKSLKDVQVEMKQQHSNYRQRKSLVGADDNVTDNGMVI